MNIRDYEELCRLRDEAKERIDFGTGVSKSGIHFYLTNFLRQKLGIHASGRQDCIKQANIAIEQYERDRFGTSERESRYLDI